MQGDVKETGSGTLKISRFGQAKRIFQGEKKKKKASTGTLRSRSMHMGSREAPCSLRNVRLQPAGVGP